MTSRLKSKHGEPLVKGSDIPGQYYEKKVILVDDVFIPVEPLERQWMLWWIWVDLPNPVGCY